MILSVDPGTKHCGLALWEDKILQLAWLVPTGGFRYEDNIRSLTEIVIERPQIYSSRFLRGDPNDLVSVAIVGAELAGYLRSFYPDVTVKYVYPKTWKGNVDKAAHGPRILAELSIVERDRIAMPRAVKTLGHNVIDAVGIGLWSLGRMQRGTTKRKKA